MQKHEDGYVVIVCDFTGTEWDEHIPMIEGHQGSVICLDALKLAIEQHAPATEPFTCTMCRREFAAGRKGWKPSAALPGANPDAWICYSCIRMADREFGKDPDTKWAQVLKKSDKEE